MFLHWRANLANQNKHQALKINIGVRYHTVLSVWNKPLIDTCQCCSTNRANQALRLLTKACRFLKSRDLSTSVSFLPLPLLSFFGSCLISHAAKTENPVPRSFFAPKLNGNACYTGYKVVLRLPDSLSNWNLEMLVFEERGKPWVPGNISTFETSDNTTTLTNIF